jgi:hypothetical protein
MILKIFNNMATIGGGGRTKVKTCRKKSNQIIYRKIAAVI